jgi:hypothetical protein
MKVPGSQVMVRKCQTPKLAPGHTCVLNRRKRPTTQHSPIGLPCPSADKKASGRDAAPTSVSSVRPMSANTTRSGGSTTVRQPGTTRGGVASRQNTDFTGMEGSEQPGVAQAASRQSDGVDGRTSDPSGSSGGHRTPRAVRYACDMLQRVRTWERQLQMASGGPCTSDAAEWDVVNGGDRSVHHAQGIATTLPNTSTASDRDSRVSREHLTRT